MVHRWRDLFSVPANATLIRNEKSASRSPVWYLGTLGYLLFFLYRYMISRKRKRAVEQYGLIPKLMAAGPLSEVDREVLVYLLSSIRKSRENLNYLFIFGLSFVAIIADQILVGM